MAKDTLIEQLNDAIDKMVTSGTAAPSAADPSLAGLLEVANVLCDLPRADFKARLQEELTLLDAADEDSKTGGKTMYAKPAPAADQSVTMYLCCQNASSAIEFYKKAFEATETMRLVEPGGRIGHAELLIGNTTVMLADEYPELGIVSPESLGGSPVILHLYVDDVDAFTKRAIAAGATLKRPIENQFYGDRSGMLADPFGHQWTIATRIEKVSAEEVKRRFDALVQSQGVAGVKPVPEGFRTVTPYLQVDGAARLIDFMREAFDVKQVFKCPLPDGSIMHAEARLGDSMIELADAGGEYKAMPAAIHLYVEDADSTYERAIRAGGISLQAPIDQFYGDREACVRDPLGNNWYIATHKLTGKPIPEGLHSVTAYLHPRGADKLIDFLGRAFDAEVAAKHAAPDGTIGHAKVKIGDSIIEMGEAHEEWGPMPTAIHLYVEDVDAVYRSAIQAGATSMFEPRDEPYGDRASAVTDPFDNVWYIATHKRDVSFDAPAFEDGDQSPKAEPVREGFTTLTPYITVQAANELVDFVKEVFAGEETFRSPGTGGGTHFEVRIGDSMVMIGGGPALRTSAPTAMHVYVADCDAVFQRAVQAGATIIREPADQFYGERSGSVRDRFGNNWYIATYKGERYIPEGFPTVTTCLHPVRTEPVVTFLTRAFGAKEEHRSQSPDGIIHHTTVRIGDAVLEMGDAHGEYQPLPTMFMVYVPDVDAVYRRALEAGATSIGEPEDQSYGDYVGAVTDPFGNQWYIAMPKKPGPGLKFEPSRT